MPLSLSRPAIAWPMSPGLTMPTLRICMRVPFMTEGVWKKRGEAYAKITLFPPGDDSRRRSNGHLSYPVPRDAQLDELHEQPRADVALRHPARRVPGGDRRAHRAV